MEMYNKKFKELWGDNKDKPTTPELKELPEHLKYVFLSEDTLHPTIISRKLSKVEKVKPF